MVTIYIGAVSLAVELVYAACRPWCGVNDTDLSCSSNNSVTFNLQDADGCDFCQTPSCIGSGFLVLVNGRHSVCFGWLSWPTLIELALSNHRFFAWWFDGICAHVLCLGAASSSKSCTRVLFICSNLHQNLRRSDDMPFVAALALRQICHVNHY